MVSRKANIVLKYTNRGITRKAHTELILLQSAFAKPQLNYCVREYEKEKNVRIARGLENVLSKERL